MRSVLIVLALLVGAVPASAERGHETERGKTQRPPQQENGPTPLVNAWWQSVGDPAVYAFRDCAIVHITIDSDATSPGYLAGREVFRACSKEFDHLHGVLASAYADEDKVKAAFDRISQSTILPALDDAIQRKLAVEAGQRSPQDEKSWTALNRLFECGADSSRSQASGTTESNEAIVKVALGRCAPLLKDYVELSATTAAQKRELERKVMAKFKPFVIQQVAEMRAAVQPPETATGPDSGSLVTGQ
jgi:hypothetical protein